MRHQVIKQTDPASRLEALMGQFEDEFRAEFLQLINSVKNNLDLDEIAGLIEAGQTQQVIDQVNAAISRYSDTIILATVTAGRDTADFISDALNVIVGFDQTNENAVRAMRDTRLRLISGVTQTQREAIRESLLEGIRTGANPISQATNLRNSIGLTQRQVQQVNNYRRALEKGSLSALRRELRDARFDSTVRRAARGETVLTQAQIDRMVARYEERLLRFRSTVVSRTEALRATHLGSELMYTQAVDTGVLEPSRIERIWITASDERVRGSHAPMNGQVQQYGQPFISGNGNELMYPGDIDAPANETIQCRCVLRTRLLPIGEA